MTSSLVHITLLMGAYLVIRLFSRGIWLHALVWLPATLMHELSHFVIGFLLNAKPVGISIWPKRIKGTNNVLLGHVAFHNLSWWKALPVGVAPLAILFPLAYLMLGFSMAPGLPTKEFILYSFAALQCLEGCWPSPQDWALARPAIYVLLALFALAVYFDLGLTQRFF